MATDSHLIVRRIVLSCAALLAFVAATSAPAETRAWLDRDRIVLGEGATLNIETDQATVRAPEYAPLRRDFVLDGHTSRRSMERGNGRTMQRSLFAVAIQPRRAGTLRIPALQVGGERTAPLVLTVLPIEAAPAPAQAGDTVFIEVEVDDAAPYVQQAVGVVLRLHYAVPLVSGDLQLPAPEGATLRRVGDDLQYTRELAGRRYTVLERRYLLIPERSGTLAMPGAQFQGRGVAGFFDDLFGGRGDGLSASGRVPPLRVLPMPDGAAQPWLPLRDLRLRYAAAPQAARAGEAATVVVEAQVDGAGAGALPELELRVDGGAQVFADPAQVDERLRDGRPQATITRRFAVVPAAAGPLRIEGPVLAWWDVDADAARTATLPALALDVAPGQGAYGGGAADGGAGGAGAETRSLRGAAGDGWVRVPGIQGEARPWAVVAVGFALLWLVTLAWALGRRHPRAGAGTSRTDGGACVAAPAADAGALRRALDHGDLGGVLDALHALAPREPGAPAPAPAQLLDDPAQREALAALEAARWGNGDPAAAREVARRVFAKGPKWRGAGRARGADDDVGLPPLYPD